MDADRKRGNQDEEVTLYLVWQPYRNLKDSEARIEHCLAVFDYEKNLKYMIVERDSDTAIGMIDATVDGHQARRTPSQPSACFRSFP